MSRDLQEMRERAVWTPGGGVVSAGSSKYKGPRVGMCQCAQGQQGQDGLSGGARQKAGQGQAGARRASSYWILGVHCSD